MQNGKVVFVIDEYLKENNISKYKVIKNCKLSATQLNSFCNNKAKRIDLAVLTRLCEYLNCDTNDIVTYRK